MTKTIMPELYSSFFVSRFLKKALNENRIWPLQFLTKTQKRAYFEDKSVNLPNALYTIRPTTQIYKRHANPLIRKNICPVTGRTKAVGGRFILSRVTVRAHLKATLLTGYRKASW